MNMSKPQQKSPRIPNHKCCGVVGGSESETRKNRQRPQPWVIRKVWILVTLGIMGYSGYAYIARLCLPMIKRTQGALGSQATGIVLLIFFSILYLWMIWAYFKVILTSPGYARDHVVRTQRPPLASSYYNSHQDGAPPPSETVKSDSIEEQKRSLSEKASQTIGSNNPQDGDSGAGPSYEQMLRSDSRSSNPFHTKEPSAGVLDGIVPLSLSIDDKPSTPSAAGASQQNQPTSGPVAQSKLDARKVKRLSKQAERNSRLDQLDVFRKPPSTPILQPVFRYCDTDEFVKPHRSHHCSSCGTCVLRYDHHCPWIGQCVGARNHKFFLNFCFATCIFTAYVLASSLPFIVRSLRGWQGDSLEPHFLVLLALAALFWIFTTALCISHVRLITHGQTTVESMRIKAIQDRDEYTLAKGFAWWELSAKAKRRKAFDEEWGSVNTEGNMWWRGSPHEEWRDVMGKSWLGWIFPLDGKFGDDHGLSYPVNPRFDDDGRLRKRSEWPEELR